MWLLIQVCLPREGDGCSAESRRAVRRRRSAPIQASHTALLLGGRRPLPLPASGRLEADGGGRSVRHVGVVPRILLSAG
jgi:hypothetical protein